MSKYKCVIFDCDGVLVDSEPISNGVLVDMANEFGANINLEYAMKNFKGGSLYGCIAKIEALIGNALPSEFETDYRKRSYDAFKNEVKPVEGIHDVLANISPLYCLASSGPVEKIRLNLSLTGLLEQFENKIFSCYDIQKWKPDPAVFFWAAETMGFEPHECVIIEDSLSGVKAAQNGGFDVFGFTAHDYQNELKSEATLTFNSMFELPRLLIE